MCSINAYSADYGQLKRYLCRFDSEGKNLVYQDVTEEMGRGSYVGDMALDGQGRIYVFTSEHAPGEEAGVWLYTEEGSYQGELSFGASETVVVRGTANGEADRLYVCISKGESPDHCTVWEADFQEKKLTKVIDDFPNINGLCMGDSAGVAGQSAGAMEQHNLLLYDDRYVYGYNFSVHENGFGQTLEELFAWTDSDINGYFVESMGVLEDGGYYAAVEDWENNDRCIQGGTLLFPKNAFGITSVSQQKEGAWAFLESVLGAEEEIYNLRWMFGEFPSLKKHMDTIASNEIEEDRKWAEEGYEFGARIFEDGTIIQFHAVTREEIDTVLGLVKHARPCFSAQEDQVLRIIGEEAAAYYSGQKGAGDVMRIIQNRVQLYVNESR